MRQIADVLTLSNGESWRGKRELRTASDEPKPWKKYDLILEWNFVLRSGGNRAAPLAVTSILLVSVFAHSGEFTNWSINDGTSGNIVIFHLLHEKTQEGFVKKKQHITELRSQRTHLGISFGTSFKSHLGRMTSVHGVPSARKQNPLSA